jgi:hypothetical protein
VPLTVPGASLGVYNLLILHNALILILNLRAGTCVAGFIDWGGLGDGPCDGCHREWVVRADGYPGRGGQTTTEPHCATPPRCRRQSPRRRRGRRGHGGPQALCTERQWALAGAIAPAQVPWRAVHFAARLGIKMVWVRVVVGGKPPPSATMGVGEVGSSGWSVLYAIALSSCDALQAGGGPSQHVGSSS